MPTQNGLSQKQVDNIKKAVELLSKLFDCCPELGRDEYRVRMLEKLRELTADDATIRDNFGHDDPFLDAGGYDGWTERFLKVFWNRFILIHTRLNPDQDLDESNCGDKTTLFYLAITLWHETAHWEGEEDGFIQIREKEMLDLLAACGCITGDPCVERLQVAIRDLIAAGDKERGIGTGLWNEIKVFLFRQSALTLVFLAILFVLSLFVAAIKALAIGWIVLIAIALGLLCWLTWWFWMKLIPCLWGKVKKVCGAVFPGFNWISSTPVGTSTGSVARAAPAVVNAAAASGAPDGVFVSLTACQSIIIALPKPVEDEYKVLPPGGLDDLRVTAQGGNYEVEVSDSPFGPWEACTPLPASGTTTFDVPLWGAPWRYVRVHALAACQIDAVEDLDY